MNKAQQIIQKFDLHPNGYEFPTTTIGDHDYVEKLHQKHHTHIGEGWSGFADLPNGIPLIWIEAIDQFLQYVKDDYPDFQIQQIKLKYGGVRMYIDGVPDYIQDEVQELVATLHDDQLIY
jgi:hypothetical protein